MDANHATNTEEADNIWFFSVYHLNMQMSILPDPDGHPLGKRLTMRPLLASSCTWLGLLSLLFG